MCRACKYNDAKMLNYNHLDIMAQALPISRDLYLLLQNNHLAACFLKRAQLWQANGMRRLLQVLFQRWLGDSRGT